jgi:hypothetical protein
MIADPFDPLHPTVASHAAVWAHRPGFALYCVTLTQADAQARAVVVAAAHGAPLAPGVWPLNGPDDTARFDVGPVYVAARTQRIHALAQDVVTYYVLRRWCADEPTVPADPAWIVPAADTVQAAPAGGTQTASAPAPAWPFARVGHHVSRAGHTTSGADVITWRGPLLGRTIVFTTRPRPVDAHASFHVSSNARIHDTTEHPQYIDVCVHHPLDEAARTALAELAQAQDTRPVVVRCVGERVRGRGSSPGAACKTTAGAAASPSRARPDAEPDASPADAEAPEA